MATLKQVGDGIRKALKLAEDHGTIPGRDPQPGSYGQVRYEVRVSNGRKSGPAVNIKITGYEWLILAHARFCGEPLGIHPETMADVAPEFIGEWREAEGDTLIAKVDEIAGRDKYGAPIGGETKFGICIISATPGTVTRVGN